MITAQQALEDYLKVRYENYTTLYVETEVLDAEDVIEAMKYYASIVVDGCIECEKDGQHIHVVKEHIK